jgi:predicted RNase H-like nuclease
MNVRDEFSVAVGVDAYRNGWVAIVLRGHAFHCCGAYSGFHALLEDQLDAAVIAVDIPIGLPLSGRRQADVLARAFIGSRRSSVFTTAPRSVLEAPTYQDALATARGLGIAGLSKQSYGLAHRIFEVDTGASIDDRIVEVHPEVSFRAMAGKPLEFSKKTWNGTSVRRRFLAENGIVLPDDVGHAGVVPVDDVLDAAAAAWTADRVAGGNAVSLPDPPERLEDGRDAAIWY